MDNQFSFILKAAIDLQKSQNVINTQIDQLQKNAKEVNIELSTTNAKKAIKEYSVEVQNALGQNKTKLDNNITSFIKNNTKLTKDLVTQLVDVKSRIKDTDSVGLKKLNNEFRTITSTANEFGKTGDTVFTKLQKNAVQLLKHLDSKTLITSSIHTVQKMITEVKVLDSAMIDLKKVTDGTDATYNKYLDTAADSAKRLGSEISSFVSMTAEWARAGYSLAESSSLAEISTIFQNVADVDVSTSVSNIITPLKAFNIETSKAITIVDALNEVDNKFSVSAADIGNGLANSASALALAGNDLNQSIALITGGSEITQNASEMGNAIKVLSMRLRGMKGELESIGEEYEDILPVSKIQTQISNLSKGTVNIMDDLDPTKFKSTYEIMHGISDIWSKISKTDQAQLLEIVAGKQRSNQAAAIIQSFQSGQAQNALETAINSTNSALDEQQKYMDSIQYSEDKMKASFQELSNDTINSGWIKGFYDLSNILLNIVDHIGLFNIALVSIAGVIGSKTNLGLNALTQLLINVIAKMGITGAASTALSTTLSTMIPAALIILGITSIVAIYDHFNVTLKKQQELLDESKESYRQSISDLENVNQELSTVRNRITELNSKDNLSFVEQSELNKLKQTTEQLLIQKDVLEKMNSDAKNNLLNEAVKTFDKQFGSDTISENQISEYTSNSKNSGNNTILMSDPNDISAMIAAYRRFSDLKEKALKNNEDVENYNELLNQISTSLYENINDLNNYKSSLESISYSNLTDNQKSTLNEINNAIKLIYTELEPAKWKDIQFQKILNNDDLKETVDTFSKLANTELITADQISKSETLMKALSEVGITAEEAATQFNAMKIDTNNVDSSINTTTESLYALATATDDVTGYVNDFGQNVDISKLPEALGDAKTAVEDFKNILKEMDKNNGVTAESLQKITQKYPQLLSYIGDEKELRKQLLKGIKDQQDLSDDYYKDFLELDTNFYNSVLKNNSDKVNELNKYYKTDLSNYKSLAQAKNEVETTLLASLNNKWADYYKAQSLASALKTAGNNMDVTFKDFGLFLGDGKFGEANDALLKQAEENANNAKKAAEKESKMYKEAADLFLNTDFTELNLSSINSGSKKVESSKKDNEFLQSIDLISQSISNLSNKVNDAQKIFDNTFGYENQITAINNLISAQKKLASGYKTSAKVYKSQYDNITGIDGYKKAIQGGSTFTVADFTDEDLYNKVKSAQDLWNNYQDYINKSVDIQITITEERAKKTELTVNKLFDDLEHNYSMGKVSEEKYYNTRMAYADKYYKGNERYLSEYQSIQEEYYKWSKEKTEEELKDKLQKNSDIISGIIDNYGKAYSSINNLASKYEDGSALQMQVYISGISKATEEIKYLNEQITKLDKMRKSGSYKGNMDLYYEQLNKLRDALYEAKSAIQEFQESMSKSIEAQSRSALDTLEKSYEKQKEYLEDQKNAYAEIINSQKELIDLKEKQRDYEKSIAEKTKDISKIEARMAELQKAAQSGDRKAQKELSELQDDLADKKEDLTETQHDHEIDLQKDALDNALDANNKVYDARLIEEKSIYDKKVENINSLYEKEMQLILMASEYTKEQFASALNEINTELANLGVNIDSNIVQNILNAQSGIAGTGGSNTNPNATNNPTKQDSQKDAQIRALLSSGTSTKGDSALNKYIHDNYGSYLRFEEMVQLAKLLGLSGINDVSDVESNSGNREKIRKALISRNALISSGFKIGGVIKSSGIESSDIHKSTGEQVVIGANVGEGIITADTVKVLQSLDKNANLESFENVISKLSDGYVSNYTTNNSNVTPSIVFNLNGSYTEGVKPVLNNWTKDITSEIVNIIRKL